MTEAQIDAAAFAMILRRMGARHGRALLSAFPNPGRLLNSTPAELVAAVGPKAGRGVHALGHGWDALWREAQATVRRHLDAGYAIVTVTGPGYPTRLRAIPDPPLVLFVRGQLDCVGAPDSVAIVGTRTPTERGRAVARRLAEFFASRGYVIVSGLAKGIDTEAHRGALGVSGRTIAVLGTPIDKAYPAENRELAVRIAATNGALVSELGMGEISSRRSFVLRDRIQSGLSLAVIPVETDVDGGTMHTAKFAQTHGRLIVTPRPPADAGGVPAYRGIVHMLEQGTATAFDAEDFDDVYVRIQRESLQWNKPGGANEAQAQLGPRGISLSLLSESRPADESAQPK